MTFDASLIIELHDHTEFYRMESARRDFVANASHELRTPLARMKFTLASIEKDDANKEVWNALNDNIHELEKLVRNNNIGSIKMEVQRNAEPTNNFLQQVRQLATETGIALIFDECTSGFRVTFGGLHQKYDVEPDIAIFGKTLGNGYAISAVIGSSKFMSAAQSTFISSTFWTERIGPTAAYKTLEVMEREKSWETISTIGRMITDRWCKLASEYDLELETSGLSSLTSFVIRSEDWLKYKTLITQEMLKNGYLASNAVYTCTEHSDEIVDGYFESLERVFATIRECEDERIVDNLLEVPCCHAGFKRLN